MRRYKVIILPSAEDDIYAARNWYKQHNEYLPKRLKQQIQVSISRISETPFAYAIRYKNIRIANIGVFPYAIHYLLQNETILVIAIHHTAMDPEKWHKRI